MNRILMLGVLCIMAATTAYAQWRRTNGPPGGRLTTIVANDSMIIASSINGGIARYHAGTWSEPSERGMASLILNGATLIGRSRDGYYRSTDFGDTWQPLAVDGALFSIGQSLARIFQDSLSISADGGTGWVVRGSLPRYASLPVLHRGDLYVLAGFANDSLYRSSDTGAHWTLAAQNLKAYGGQPTQIADGHDRLLLVIGRTLVLASTDYGEHFSDARAGLDSAAAVDWIVSSDSAVWGGSYNQIWRLDRSRWIRMDAADLTAPPAPHAFGLALATKHGPALLPAGGTKLVLLNGLNRSSVPGITALGNAVLASTGDRVFRSDDRGTTWEECGRFPAFRLFAFGTAAYAIGGELRVTHDAGRTWQPVMPLANDANGEFNAMAADNTTLYLGHGATSRTDDGAMLWSNGGMLRSTDGGTTWLEASTGLPIQDSSYAPVTWLAAGNGWVIASTAAGLYRSSDHGMTWQTAEVGIPVGDLIPGGGPLYNVDNNPVVLADSGLYQSTDGGGSWSRLVPKTPRGKESDMFPGALDGVLYLQTYDDPGDHPNVFTYAYDGHGWYDITDSMPQGMQVYTLARSGNTYYAGTRNHGVWRRDDDVAQAPDDAQAGMTIAAAPNPASDVMTVTFTLGAPGAVHLSLRNTIGEIAGQIFAETLAAGTYSRRVSLRGLPRGVYFVHLQLGNRSTVQRVAVQ
ncbi:MAG TPA: T9SS type A sorting domain-containing protein [Candidatus Kapabacteria bacterium]|nr:T9SS type A sorting domain-containing protein [Candidatus Kapabacteria bacterium]